MNKIFFIHFNEAERREKIFPLKKAGYKVDYHFSTETVADLRKDLPEVLVVCLDRLPSHGKRYAGWLWEAMKRQHIPVVFCGGNPKKILNSSLFLRTANRLVAPVIPISRSVILKCIAERPDFGYD